MTIGTSATLIADQGGKIAPLVVLVRNVGARTVFLGPASVDSTCYQLPAGAEKTIALFGADKMYGLVTASTCDVTILETAAEGAFEVVGVPVLSSVLAQGNDAAGQVIANAGDPVDDQDVATKASVIAEIAAANVMRFKGDLDCSGNPNYPAADAGDTYKVSVAGKIGGGSGVVVAKGALLICKDDGVAAGNQAAVGSHWSNA